MYVYVTLLVALVGLLLYAFAKNGKLLRLGPKIIGVLPLLLIIGISGAIPSCNGKESPGPEPTPAPAVCQRVMPAGAAPWCEDRNGNRAVCEDGYEKLPICP